MQFRSISNVRRLGETPEAYIMNVEIDFGGGWEASEYVARVGGGGLCDPILAAITAGDYVGEITDYAPTPTPPPSTVSARQFLRAVATAPANYPETLRPSSPRETPWISETEAEVWAMALALPAVVLTAINALPEAERFAARVDALRMTEVKRKSPLIDAVFTTLNATEAERDTLFWYASTL